MGADNALLIGSVVIWITGVTGRFGGILSTALGGVLPSIRVAFVLQSVAFVVGGFLSCAFGLETSRRSLRDAV